MGGEGIKVLTVNAKLVTYDASEGIKSEGIIVDSLEKELSNDLEIIRFYVYIGMKRHESNR